MKTPLLIVGLLMFVLLILMLVYQIKFESRFIKFNGAKPWILAVWIFIPVIAYIYFAFIHKNYDIPGVTEKEMYNI